MVGCTTETAPGGQSSLSNAMTGGTPATLSTVNAGELLITEMLVDPNGTDNPQEWIELHNLHGSDVDLDGLVVTDTVTGNTFTVSGPLVIPDGGYLVLGETGNLLANGGVVLDYAYGALTLPLFNEGATVVLSFGATTFDTVAYVDAPYSAAAATWPLAEGYAMSLVGGALNATDNDDPANWCVGTGTAYGTGGIGTPGEANTACPDTADDLTSGSLLLTEILFNPSATGDGDGEWFEFRVDHATPIDLEGLVVSGFVEGTATVETFTVTEHLIHQPGDYVVFAVEDDPTQNGNVDAQWDWSNFNLFNNSDTLELLTPSAVQIDTVSWDNGVTFPDPSGASMVLEPTLPYATVANNDLGSSWCEANVAWPGSAGDFGSPGQPNQSCLDRDMDGQIAEQFGGPDCDDTDASVLWSDPNNAATVMANETEDDGIDNNCDGLDAWLGPASMSVGDLVITEIHKEPAAVGSLGEWFELQNVSTNRVDLIGIEVSDDTGDTFTFETFLVLDPGEIVVIARDDDATINGGVTAQYDWPSGWGLSNNDDQIVLTFGGTELDRVEYDNDDYPDVAGASLSLEPTKIPGSDNNSFDDWCDAYTTFGDGDYGSPGAANPTCIGRDVDGDGSADADWGGDDCNDRDGTIFPAAVEIPDDRIDQNCDGSDSVVPLTDLTTGDLVISEIMAAPNGVAGSDGEWFEIYNASGVDVDLNGLILENNKFDVFEAQSITVDEIVYLPAGEYALFVTKSDPAINGDLPFTYTRPTDSDPTPTAPNDYHFEFVSFTLKNRPNTLTLRHPDGTTLFDEVIYDSSFPANNGSSIQLDPSALDDLSNDDAENWCIGRTLIGTTTGNFGSPGVENGPCTWTMDFTFDYVYTGTNPNLFSFSGSTTILLDQDGTFTTGNLGDGPASYTSTATGQHLTWDYLGVPTVYEANRPFGDACYSGTILDVGDYTTTWSGCEIPTPVVP